MSETPVQTSFQSTMAKSTYNDFDQLINLINFLLPLHGNDIFNVKYTKIIQRKALRFLPMIIIGLLSPVMSVTALIYNQHNFPKLVETILVTAASFQTICKMCLFEKVYKEMIELHQSCGKFRGRYADDLKNDSEIFLRRNFIKRSVFVIRVAALLYWTDNLVKFVESFFSEERSLPFELYLPVGMPFESPYYEINYVAVVVVTSLVTYYMIGLDAIFIMFVSEICLQLDVLEYKSLSQGDDEIDGNTEVDMLRDIHEMHWDISRSINDLNNIYSGIFVSQFFSSFIMVSTVLFMVTKDDSSSIITAIALILQLGLYCVYGQVNKIAFNLYNNCWYNLGVRPRKSLITMMCYAHVTPTLKAVGYLELSLATYFKILKSAYSYLAVMRDSQPEE